MVKGKCNCKAKATVEYIIYHKDYATTMKFCDKCKPKYKTKGMEILEGK